MQRNDALRHLSQLDGLAAVLRGFATESATDIHMERWSGRGIILYILERVSDFLSIICRVAPMLCAGNAVLLGEDGEAARQALEVLRRAGFPAGTLQLISLKENSLETLLDGQIDLVVAEGSRAFHRAVTPQAAWHGVEVVTLSEPSCAVVVGRDADHDEAFADTLNSFKSSDYGHYIKHWFAVGAKVGWEGVVVVDSEAEAVERVNALRVDFVSVWGMEPDGFNAPQVLVNQSVPNKKEASIEDVRRWMRRTEVTFAPVKRPETEFQEAFRRALRAVKYTDSAGISSGKAGQETAGLPEEAEATLRS